MSQTADIENRSPVLKPDSDSILNTPSPVINRLAILGLGLIGGSIGLALSEARVADLAFQIVGWDNSAEVCTSALERGAIQEIASSPEAAVENAELIVLAVPVSASSPLLEKISEALSPTAVVTDVGSTKARLVATGESILGGRFVGGHPMAGSEQSGIAAATHTLFQGAVWILTPTQVTNNQALDLVNTLVRATGASLKTMPPARHDEVIAVLSHLPHLLAYSLSQTASDLTEVDEKELAAGSFTDGTRVAKSAPRLWTDILLDNREAILEALSIQSQWIDTARSALEAGNPDRLFTLLSHAQQSRRNFT